MTKKVMRLARMEGGVVVSVDDLLEFLGDMMGIFDGWRAYRVGH